ncbi:MAG: TonB-dependent receptor plug domain-containing protein [Pseudobdellovibrionaceae bacterium]
MRFFFIGALVFSSWAFAQEGSDEYRTVIRTDSFSTASKVVIDEKTIRESKAPNIPALLASQANISIVNSNFQPSSIFIRGGDSSHVLILVDGLPAYDPTTTQRTLNLSNIDITTVRRIEVIKGSQSVLYGGQALTGVIKIETFPTQVADQAAGQAEAGQREYRKAAVFGMKALDESQGVLARASMTEKNNHSPLKESDFTYHSKLLNGDVGYLRKSDFDFFLKLNGFDDYSEQATGYGDVVLDTKHFEARNQFWNLTGGVLAPQVPLKPSLLASYQQGVRKFEQTQPWGDVNSRYQSELLNVRLETFPVDREQDQLRFGASHTKENFSELENGQEISNQFQYSSGVFAKYDRELAESLSAEGGLRSDFVYGRDRVDSYQLGMTVFKDWRFEYATGFKVPSLFQLYSENYGSNKDLKAETSRTLTLTYSHTVSERQNFSISVFETSFSNLIVFVGAPATGRYENVQEARSRGAEAVYAYRTEDNLKLDLSFGYQEPRNITTGEWLLKRSLVSGGARLLKEWERDSAGFELIGNGVRFDSRTYDRLPGYMTTNLFYNHDFIEHVSGYIRGNNVFDQRYQQSKNYFDEGAFWFVGMEFRN